MPTVTTTQEAEWGDCFSPGVLGQHEQHSETPSQKEQKGRVPMAHACNPSYLGG
jgi:hypothetical protein